MKDNSLTLTEPALSVKTSRRIVLTATVVLLILMLLLSTKTYLRPPTPVKNWNVPVTMCGGLFSLAADSLRSVDLNPGLGDLHYAITTTNPLAQKYFDQGLKLVYGFNHVEALRSFQEAARLDPNCAMAFWGQALTLGPNINDWNPRDRERMALEAIDKAKRLSAKAVAKESDFIAALSARYDGLPHENRDSLNQAYKQSMKALADKYPDDPEALVLFADAIMNSMPWDYWNNDGSPKPFTIDARSALEAALKKYPRHPGAHHLYIHLVEASARPADARKSAVFLETAMPAAGHIVHMPSHIYARLGEYEKSNLSNQDAIKVDEVYLRQSADQGLYRISYYPHNIDFLCYGSVMNGASAQAVREGNKMVDQVKAMETVMPVMYDYFLSVPVISLVRFGKWDDILALPRADHRYFQTAALSHYARGTAFLRKNKPRQAEAEWKQLDSISRLDTLLTSYAFYNSTEQIVRVASDLLKGDLLIQQGRVNEGLAALKAAVAAEDSLRYNEPPDWRLPARHFMGAALLESGRPADAEKIYAEDLVKNPENGWSLYGLFLSQRKSGKTILANKTLSRFTQSWKHADVVLSASRF